MKTLMIAAGAALMIGAAPAMAQHGHGNSHSRPAWHHAGYDARHCPPGLSNKNNRCMPPGQARKRYNIGQRYAANYGNRWTYSQIPLDLRQRYRLDPNGRYYYRDGYIYRVNPATLAVQQVISAILR